MCGAAAPMGSRQRAPMRSSSTSPVSSGLSPAQERLSRFRRSITHATCAAWGPGSSVLRGDRWRTPCARVLTECCNTSGTAKYAGVCQRRDARFMVLARNYAARVQCPPRVLCGAGRPADVAGAGCVDHRMQLFSGSRKTEIESVRGPPGKRPRCGRQLAGPTRVSPEKNGPVATVNVP